MPNHAPGANMPAAMPVLMAGGLEGVPGRPVLALALLAVVPLLGRIAVCWAVICKRDTVGLLQLG